MNDPYLFIARPKCQYVCWPLHIGITVSPSEKDRESVNINIEKDSTQQDTPPKALITLFVSGMRAIIQRGDGYMVSMVWMEGGAFHSSLILVC